MGHIAVPEILIFLTIGTKTRRLGAEDERVSALPDNDGANDD
jgi:hypothetical protein